MIARSQGGNWRPIRAARRFATVLVAVALVLLSAGATIAQPTTVSPLGAVDPVEGCIYFDETGHNLCGPFDAFWQANGGLPVFGYPKTEAADELNQDLNEEFLTQYFERERLEHHPENQGTPYEVLLGRLGSEVLALTGRDWTAYPKDDPGAPNYQEATGFAIAEEFYAYWSSHGLDLGESGTSFAESLALFGYPISPAMTETNTSGDTVLTQWFERARFEYHPDNPEAFQVLLGLLGNEILDAGTPPPAQIDSFAPLSTYIVPGGGVAEIVSATPDGQWLAYTNAGAGEVGIVDISDPSAPELSLNVPVDGVPTSVSITPDGAWALVAVITSELEFGAPPVFTPGLLYVIAMPSGAIAGTLELGNGPDSVATKVIDGQLYAVVAIENEPVVLDADGNRTEDEEPGLEGDVSGPGFVQIVAIDQDDLASSTVTDVTFDPAELAALNLFFPDDPQPEFVSINNQGQAAVTLQENNGIAVIDVAAGTIDAVFNVNAVGNRPADLTADDMISFTESYPEDVVDVEMAGARFPDAVDWSADGTTLYTADEGEFDYTGGRGWSIRSADGGFIWDDGGSLEATAVAYSHYPDGRSDAKGIEVEGVEVGAYGDKTFAFVGSERGSFVGVYEMADASTPEWVQLLPTGISPEGLLAIPARNLFLTSDEVSGTISIFQGVAGVWEGSPDEPTLRSGGVDEPWAALSGLAAGPESGNLLYAVPDNAMPSAIYTLATGGDVADVELLAPITSGGEQAFYDLEGIVIDTSIVAPESAGFWLASEGNAAFGEEGYQPNVLVQVDAGGAVLQEIMLPAEVDSPAGGLIGSNGFEGVTLSDDGRYLLAAVQRQHTDDAENGGLLYTRIARYDLQEELWEFYLYPLDAPPNEDAWIGLSEITSLGGGLYAVIERDNQLGAAAQTKKVYSFSLDGLTPHDGLVTADANLTGAVLSKTEIFDVLDAFAPFEKVEGLAVTPTGDVWALLDNDGGELRSVLVNLGPVPE